MYWMVTNRNINANKKTFGDELTSLSFWQNASDKVDSFDNWTQLKEDDFRQGLVATADAFPDPSNAPSEDQMHVNLFVHGFDNTWLSAVQRYGAIVNNLFTGPEFARCMHPVHMAIRGLGCGISSRPVGSAPIRR